MRGSGRMGISMLWDEVSLMNGCKGGGGVGGRVNELIDCHTRVASTFSAEGSHSIHKKNSKKLNNNDPVHFGTAFQWSLSFNSLSYPLKINKINIRRCYCKGALECSQTFWQTRRQDKWGEQYYKKYHKLFYAGRPLYNTYYFSIRQALPTFGLCKVLG